MKEGLTFLQRVWTVLCGMGGLAAALRTTAGWDCWTSHLYGFVSNYGREFFILQ